MSSDLGRVGELEQTIERMIAYLRRLPAVPETYHLTAEAEAVLRKNGDDISLRGATFLPSGIALLGAQMNGITITLQTQDVAGMPDSFQSKHKQMLFEELVKGIKVRLDSKPFEDWGKFFCQVGDT
jgi:hypothetical protein